MVNIEKITSTLAKLPDQALQRYAMMHKDDPYIVALAVSESNRRKEMRAASQAQPMQQQPKVVDQAVAEMAPQQMPAMPEEQGIGALPVQMDFADGGITGYAGGGEVERYQAGGSPIDRILKKSPYERTPEENLALRDAGYATQRAVIPADSGVAKANTFLENLGPNIRGYFTEGKNRLSDEELASLPSTGGVMNERLLRSLGMGPSAPQKEVPTAASGAPTSNQGVSAYRPEDTSGMDRRLATPGATLPMAANVTKGEVGGGNRGTGGTGGADGSGGAGVGASRATAPSSQSIEDRFLESQKRLTGQANPYQTQEDALAAEQKKFAEDKLAATIEKNEKFKDAFKGREGRIEERAKELEKSKDTNTGLAFLEAGLAIMATPGGLATAIGKGAREGTAKYAAGIEKLRSAKEKLDEARDRMEELKLNRDEMSAKEEMEAKLGIQQTVISGKKDALASAKALFGERSALSQAIVKETINVEERAKDRATQAQTAGAAAAIALGPQNKFIQDWLSKKENQGKSYSDAYAAFKNLGAASERNDITGLKAVQAGLIKEISENLTMTKAEKAAKQAQINEINNRILALTGAAAPSTTGGAQRTIDWNSIK